MFEKLIGKKIKVIYKDDDRNKIAIGLLREIENFFLCIEDEERGFVYINQNYIINLKIYTP